MDDTNTLDGLASQVVTLTKQVKTLLFVPAALVDVNRQIQTIQGGNLEPISRVSGWKLNVGFSDPMVAGGSLFVGRAQMLLAGKNIQFSRPANSPFLEIDASGGSLCYDYVVIADGSGTHTTIAAMMADFLIAAQATSYIRKIALVCGQFTETNIELGTGATLDNTSGSSLTIVGRGSAASNYAGSINYKSALIAHITGVGDAFFKTTKFNTPQIAFRNLRLMTDDTLGTMAHSFISDVSGAGTTRPRIDCYDCRLEIGSSTAANGNGIFVNSTGATADVPIHRFYNCSGYAGMLYLQGWGGVELHQSTLQVYQLVADDNQSLNNITIDDCSITTQNYLFHHTAGNQLSFSITGSSFRQNGSAIWLSYASGQVGSSIRMFIEGVNFSTSDTTHNAINVGCGLGSGQHTLFIDSCTFIADTANSATAVVITNPTSSAWLNIYGGNIASPNYVATVSGISAWLPSLVIGGSSSTSPSAGVGLQINSPTTAGAGQTILMPSFPTTALPAVGINAMFYYDSALNRFRGFENSAWATFVTNEGEGLKYAVLAGRGSPVGNIFTGYASWGVHVGISTVYSTAVTGIAGLQAYWRAGESSGNLTDTTANVNTMVAHGTPTYSVTGALTGDTDTAISLPGNTANYFEAPNSTSLNTADTFSVVAWVKPTAIGSFMEILSRTINGYQTGIDTTGHFYLAKQFVAVIATSTTILSTSAYSMVAVTKTGATVKLYINNVDVTGAVTNQTISATGGVVDIGRNPQNNTAPFSGAIDEVALWNVALAAADITTLWNAAAAGTGSTVMNTTDGDITGQRLNIGNVAQTAGVEVQVTGDATISGYLQVGSNAAPTNVTAGDITVRRISIADSAHAVNSRFTITETYSNIATDVFVMQPTFAPASNGKAGVGITVFAVVAPTAHSTSSSTGVNGTLSTTGAFNLGALTGLQFQVTHAGSGTATNLQGMNVTAAVSGATAGATSLIRGLSAAASLASTVVSTHPLMQAAWLSITGGTATAIVTTITGIEIVVSGLANITSTIRRGINIPDMGSGTVTDVLGIDIAVQTAGIGQTAGIRNADFYLMGSHALPTVAPAAGYVAMFSFAKATGDYQDTPRFYDSGAHDSGSTKRAHNGIPLPLGLSSTTLVTNAIPSTILGFTGLVIQETPITLHSISYTIGTAATGTGVEIVRLVVYTESGSLITGTNVTDSPGLAIAGSVRTVVLGADVYLPAGNYYAFVCMGTDSSILNPAIDCFTQDTTYAQVNDILVGTVVCVAGAAPSPLGAITFVASRTPYLKFNGAAT